jgi:hypothetical protein
VRLRHRRVERPDDCGRGGHLSVLGDLGPIGKLCSFDHRIGISHRDLLAVLVAVAGVPAEKFKPACSSTGKLPWEKSAAS